MEYRNLGRSGLKVSPLCLGTMTFGEADEGSFMHQVGCDEPTSFAIMNEALDAGINFFDTADVYGQDGLTERVIGKWFAQDGRRDEVVLATKFRFRMGKGPNGTGASRFRVVKTVEDSLRRLQTDHIDLYQIHMQDRDVPEDELLRALDDLVRQGKVLYIGCSNYTAYRMVESQWVSKTQNLERFVSAQMQYSLAVRDIEREVVPVCDQYGLGILPWSPLAGGFLTGKYKRDEKPPAGSRLEKWKDRFGRFDTDRNWSIIETLDGVAKELDSTPATVALAWLLRKPAVTSVIFGARSLKQLRQNLAAAELELPDGMVQRLDEVSKPGWGYPYEFISAVQGQW
jgi:aryl-alcohol dehydrogenase-like predicted oxidoreductase